MHPDDSSLAYFGKLGLFMSRFTSVERADPKSVAEPPYKLKYNC